MNRMTLPAGSALLLAAFFSTSVNASCGSAYCTVNSDWTTEGAITETGMVLDLRYEFINQNQPRAGTKNVAVGEIPHHHDEVSTANRNLLLTYSLSMDEHWGVSIVAPIVQRNHFHIHHHRDEQVPERWSFTELGDLRVVGRYQVQGPNAERPSAAGLTFGLKLPTGRTNIANSDGDVAERTLQPGSGTTDGIIGAYYHEQIPAWNGAWFAQVQYQRALNSSADFKPGDRFGADIGYRQRITEQLAALIQVNLSVKGRDSGAQAEPDDSGFKNVSLSPGLSLAVTDSLQAYGFVQVPVYQNVNGVQLTSSRAYVVGVGGRF